MHNWGPGYNQIPPELMKKIAFLIFLFMPTSALAFCPVCTVAVGAGLGLSRWLGVDDVISSIWIGALIVSLIGWTLKWLKKYKFRCKRTIIAVSWYVLVFLPLYFAGMIGHLKNNILGTDKIIFGVVLGSAIFLFSIWLHNRLKKGNNNKVYFVYQGVIIPVLTLLLASLIIFLWI